MFVEESLKVLFIGAYYWIWLKNYPLEKVTNGESGTFMYIESVTAGALEEMSQPIDRTVCDSDRESVDARYVIELDGETYELDSCETNVEADAAAWEVLGGIWYWFELSDPE